GRAWPRSSLPAGGDAGGAAGDGGRGTAGRRRVLGERRPEDLVGGGVALGQEPALAAGAVHPPLALAAGDVAAEVDVAVQLGEARPALRPRADLAAEAEVRDLADAAVGAGEEVGHQRASWPGIQEVPASGTRAIAAASTVSATRSSGSRFCTRDLPQARARVCVSWTRVRR